jgi:purine-binding chemotaxis protein CheW
LRPAGGGPIKPRTKEEASGLRVPAETTVLLVRAGRRLCALPVAAVVETMRPLPFAPLAGLPPFVRGAAVVRGTPLPVVHLDALLGGGEGAPPGRFVVVRCAGRQAALAVDAVLGLARLAAPDGAGAPLLAGAAAGAVGALGALDRELLVLLESSRLVPEEAWAAARAGGGA